MADPIEFFFDNNEVVSIAILIDTSASAQTVIDGIKRSATEFIRLLDPRDRASVITFDHDVHSSCPFTSDHGWLELCVADAQIAASGLPGSAMRDAPARALSSTLKDVNGRKAVVLLTDGKDIGNKTSRLGLFDRLTETDTSIYLVIFPTGSVIREKQLNQRGMTLIEAEMLKRAIRNVPKDIAADALENHDSASYLDKIAHLCGGRSFVMSTEVSHDAFRSILRELRSSYG